MYFTSSSDIFMNLHSCHFTSHFVKCIFIFCAFLALACCLETSYPNRTALSKMVFDKMMMIMKLLKINVIIRALDSSLLNKQMHPHLKTKAIPLSLVLSFSPVYLFHLRLPALALKEIQLASVSVSAIPLPRTGVRNLMWEPPESVG